MDKKESKVIAIAESVLAEKQYVSPLDILLGLGILHLSHVEEWRKGRVPYLERVIQSNLSKISAYMKAFRKWAREKGLKPSQTVYTSRTRDRHPLQFCKSGAPDIELHYSTHFVSPDLSEQKQIRIAEKERKAELVCYLLITNRQCAECHNDLPRGSFLFMEKDQPLCLFCADLDHLVYLPSGDSAITRRARKYSDLSVVVVQFNRTRKRYERQGVLVTEEALTKAEVECLADEEIRAQRRERTRELSTQDDERLAEAMRQRILELFPFCPTMHAESIAKHTTIRHSGRVGRTAAGRALEDDPIMLAVRAYIRHRFTDYDKLLMEHGHRTYARLEIQEKLEDVFREWQGLAAPLNTMAL